MQIAELIIVLQQAPHHRSPLIHAVLGMGMVGLFFLAVVDSSFIPLPLPGATDILLVVLAAKQHHWIWMTLIATIGSVIGGALTYHLGEVGGVHGLEKRIPAKYLKHITTWTERHGILAVALPAILPPPFPLIPFLLAAGALKVPRRKFYAAFTLSRGIRHAICAWLGFHYGRHILRAWNTFYTNWSTPFLITLWTLVILSSAYAIWSLIKHNRKDLRAFTT